MHTTHISKYILLRQSHLSMYFLVINLVKERIAWHVSKSNVNGVENVYLLIR